MVEATLRWLNPTAKLIRTSHGVVNLSEVLGTGLYDPELASHAPGWAEELAGGHTPETEEFGIRSTTYRADRPFHPLRLEAALTEIKGLLRSKGLCWIASRPEVAAIWSQAGPYLVIEPAQLWTTTDETPGQEIVFIGVKLDIARLERALGSALLTDTERADGPQTWRNYRDPLPAWESLHH